MYPDTHTRIIPHPTVSRKWTPPPPDPDTAAAVVAGLEAMNNLADSWEPDDESVAARTLRGYSLCGVPTRFKTFAIHLVAGYAPHPRRGHVPIPGKVIGKRARGIGAKDCGRPGCPKCAQRHAEHDLSLWRTACDAAYGYGSLAILTLLTPGWGPTKTRHAIGQFRRRRPVQRVLGPAMGYLTPTVTGYSVRLLVRGGVAQETARLLGAWQEIVPGGWASVERLDPSNDPLAALVDLRVQAEQALPLMVYRGEIDAEQGRQWLEEAAGGDNTPGIRRAVFIGGFQKLCRDEDCTGKCAGGVSSDDYYDRVDAGGAPPPPAGDPPPQYMAPNLDDLDQLRALGFALDFMDVVMVETDEVLSRAEWEARRRRGDAIKLLNGDYFQLLVCPKPAVPDPRRRGRQEALL